MKRNEKKYSPCLFLSPSSRPQCGGRIIRDGTTHITRGVPDQIRTRRDGAADGNGDLGGGRRAEGDGFGRDVGARDGRVGDLEEEHAEGVGAGQEGVVVLEVADRLGVVDGDEGSEGDLEVLADGELVSHVPADEVFAFGVDGDAAHGGGAVDGGDLAAVVHGDLDKAELELVAHAAVELELD